MAMIGNVIHSNPKRKEQEKLESLLLEALEKGGSQEITPGFFERLRKHAQQMTGSTSTRD